MKTKLIMLVLMIFVGTIFATEVAAQIINGTTTTLGISKVAREPINRFLYPGEKLDIKPPYTVIFSKDGVKDSLVNFDRIGTITDADLDIQKTLIFNTSDFAWLAKTGPLAGMYFEADSATGQYYAFPDELPEFFQFNAKCWTKEGDKAGFQQLGIGTTYRDSVDGPLKINFRFDQQTEQKQQRQQKFRFVNGSGDPLFLSISDKKVLLKQGRKSKPMKMYTGWYYIETSYEMKSLVWETGRLLPKKEVITEDVLFGVAENQQEYRISSVDLQLKRIQNTSITPTAQPSKPAASPSLMKRPAIKPTSAGRR